ncbi:MAG TPA: heme-binding protein [Coriobacteriia bacterium]|nr:heme-binding protein [Coriobacteriia bacterium]
MGAHAPEYEVLTHDGAFELRRYAEYLTANVRVGAGDYGRAMSLGFTPLADYIFGNNHASDRIAMTAPVTAGRACCQKIPMTTPVTAQESEDEYVVSFTMPSDYSMDDLPLPNDAAISIESVGVHLAAAARFGGNFAGSKAAQARAQLESWISEQGLRAVGEPIVAQYDPPWTPGFVRRNEIIIVVEEG